MARYQLAADVSLTPHSDGLTWCLDAPRERVVLERKEVTS
jgi:hypothetical protein